MGSEKNPVESYLEKKSGFLGDVGRSVGQRLSGPGLGTHIGNKAIDVAGGALGAAAVAGAGIAAQKIYEAATKGRDFKQMLAYDPTLADNHASDPKMFNQLYTTLRTFNPQFAKDPVVASSYMRQMLDNPGAAGGVVQSALDYRDKIKSPIEPVMRSAISAFSSGGKDKDR